MSRVARTCAVVVAAGLAVPLWAAPASAETVSEKAAIGAYFYSAGVTAQGLPVESPQAPPNVTGDNADGVSAGNLAVAGSGPQEDKISFLSFALGDLPFDATIDSAVLTVPLVPVSPSDVSYNQAPELVRICKPGDSGFFGEDGQNTMLAPARLCDEFASEPGKLSADGKAYEFDITGLAATWVEANDGLALTVVGEAGSPPFQVVFAPADQATLAYSFTAPEGDEDLFAPGAGSTGSDPVVVEDPGASFGGGTTDLGFGAAPSGGTDGFGTAEAPLVGGAPAPEALEPPPGPETAPVRTTAVASAFPSEVLSPTATFWLAGVGFAGLLALLSLIMGDPRVPAASTSPSRLSQALSARESGAPRSASRRPLAL